jgi:hypothetical protein
MRLESTENVSSRAYVCIRLTAIEVHHKALFIQVTVRVCTGEPLYLHAASAYCFPLLCRHSLELGQRWGE